MKKIITIVSALIISISACSSKTSNIIKSEETPLLSTINVIDDEKTAENYVKSKGYEIIARKGEVQKYTLENGKTLEEVTGLSYQQWRDKWKKKYAN